MQKRFVARRGNDIYTYKVIACIFIVLLGLILTVKLLFKNFTKENDNQKVEELLAISTNNLIGNLTLYDLISFNLKDPENLLKMSFSSAKIDYKEISNKKENKENINSVSNNDNKPIIYIYNTHQTEEYDAGALSYYNITPTVYMASNMLKKSLKNYDIESIVEDENILEVLNKNGWNYNDSYNVSMLWLENAIKENNSLKYFIDVHRDSVSSSVTINDKEYAKMMFVVGMNHDNYEKNESLALQLNDYLKENYEGLMRDVFYGKRSKYNQHFNENTILIEVGGPKNTITEVNNSIIALADALYHVIGNINGKEI